MRFSDLSGPKRWTLAALEGDTYPQSLPDTRRSTIVSLCNGGLVAEVEELATHGDGASRRKLGYLLTPKGERLVHARYDD